MQEGYLFIRSLKNSINPKPESTRAGGDFSESARYSPYEEWTRITNR